MGMGIDIDVDMDIDPDMAVSILGGLQRFLGPEALNVGYLEALGV